MVKKSPAKRRRRPATLDEALATLKELGFSVVVPTSESEVVRHEESKELLGFTDSAKKAPRKSQSTLLYGVLQTQHNVGGAIYGPGPIEMRDVALFQSLMKQDQLCVQGNQDTTAHNAYSRCYIIEQGRGNDGKNKFSKTEVSEHVFHSGNFENMVAVTAMPIDIAGYHPPTDGRF